MGAAEGVAEVELVLGVGEVGGAGAGGEAVAEVLAESEVEGGVLGEMAGSVAVEEAGAVVEVDGGEGVEGEGSIGGEGEGVALVVVEVKASGGGAEVGETTGDCAIALGHLVGVDELGVESAEEQGGVEGGLVAQDAGAVDGEVEEERPDN